jgi:hypothetical protein
VVALRLLAIFTVIVMAVLLAAYVISGDKKYLRWSLKTFLVASAAAIVFFAILIVQRLA